MIGFYDGRNIANRPVGRAVAHSSLDWEFCSSNFGPAKSYTVLPTAGQHCNILKGVVLPAGAMTPRLHVSRYSNTARTIKGLVLEIREDEKCKYQRILSTPLTLLICLWMLWDIYC